MPLNRSHGQRAQMKPRHSPARPFISIIITICHPAVPVTLRSICSLRATNCIPFFKLSINLLHITNTAHYPLNILPSSSNVQTAPDLPFSPFTSEYTTPDRAISVTDLFMGGISVSKQVSFLGGDLLEPLDPQTAPFSLVMDVDSSCFNEADKQLLP